MSGVLGVCLVQYLVPSKLPLTLTRVKPFFELKPTVYYYIRPQWELTHLPTICSMSQLPLANPEEFSLGESRQGDSNRKRGLGVQTTISVPTLAGDFTHTQINILGSCIFPITSFLCKTLNRICSTLSRSLSLHFDVQESQQNLYPACQTAVPFTTSMLKTLSRIY